VDENDIENKNPYSIYRRLSPLECDRLQGLSDNYSLYKNEKGKENSYTQRWKMLGNAWNIPTIKFLFKNIQKKF
jgi:site-specific DNA-cytosine methylase